MYREAYLRFRSRGSWTQVIRTYQRGTPITSENIEKTIVALETKYSAWQARTGPPESAFQLPDAFSRRGQVKKLAGILDNLIKHA